MSRSQICVHVYAKRLTRKRIILDHPPWRFKNETFRLPKGKKEGKMCLREERNNELHTVKSDEDFFKNAIRRIQKF
jgi:hypothetical protein